MRSSRWGFQVHEIEEVGTGVCSIVDENIHIAIRARLVAGNRPEEGDRLDTEPIERGFIGTQSLENVVLQHGYRLCYRRCAGFLSRLL
jgi:hypothetical protein